MQYRDPQVSRVWKIRDGRGLSSKGGSYIILLPKRFRDWQGRGHRMTVRARGNEHLRRHVPWAWQDLLYLYEFLSLHSHKTKPANVPAWAGEGLLKSLF